MYENRIYNWFAHYDDQLILSLNSINTDESEEETGKCRLNDY